ncbi:hypothetical protein HG535_0H03600 [Zygotorulaspora mrakii]|uniref:Prefoldin subunit 1 n=1 Tax=Zygotorulaspora mrakii TaxID=42260 RepID=A0A7H9B924_ZYGMR|nr:uncharacterized protein HG535_0H03600 [Zygotorulaspora mrakii]QLG75033.1 hypothetical protein HG535_0H03600 [Zygotorulaspora mrakii]
MSVSPIIQELTSNLRSSKAQLNVVTQQLDRLERQDMLAKVTATELESYPVDKVWRSCGKAFILQDKSKYVDDLKHDEVIVKDQSKALLIKKNYLETTVEKIVMNLRAALAKK